MPPFRWLLLAVLAIRLVAVETPTREALIADIGAAIDAALARGEAITFDHRLGSTPALAEVIARDEVNVEVDLRADGAASRLWLPWARLDPEELFHLGAGALPECDDKHQRLALWAAGHGLRALADRECAWMRSHGILPPAEATDVGVAPAAGPAAVDARERDAEKRWRRIEPQLAQPKRAKAAQTQLRALIADFADTALVRKHTAEWQALLTRADAAAAPAVDAMFNIPWNEAAMDGSRRADTTGAAVMWFGHPPTLRWGQDGHDGPWTNAVEVRAQWLEGGLYCEWQVLDFHIVHGNDGNGERLYILTSPDEQPGERPGPRDRMFEVWWPEAQNTYRGDGTAWQKFDGQANVGDLVEGWERRSYQEYGNDGAYNGFHQWTFLSWGALGFKPKEGQTFRIAFQFADTDRPFWPADLYAEPVGEDGQPRKPESAGSQRAKAKPAKERKPPPGEPVTSTPAAVLRRLTPTADPNAVAVEHGIEKDGKQVVENCLWYPFTGAHPAWRRWDAANGRLWHLWPGCSDLARPTTWARARLVKQVICTTPSSALAGGEVLDERHYGTFTGWGIDLPHDASGDLLVHSEQFALHMRDFYLKSFVRLDFSRLKRRPAKVYLHLPCWSGDGPVAGRTLMEVALLDGPWWKETLTACHPFQPMPVCNSVNRTWVDLGTDAVFDVTDLFEEAVRRRRTQLDLAIYATDTHLDSGKYFAKGRMKLVAVGESAE